MPEAAMTPQAADLIERLGARVCDALRTATEEVRRLREALEATLAWIDAVPQLTPLPAMPGFDRDEVNALLDRAALSGAPAREVRE